MKVHCFISVLLFVALGWAALAEEVVMGKPEDLRGTTKIYVYTTDAHAAEVIRFQVLDQLSRVHFVDTIQQAEVILQFIPNPTEAAQATKFEVKPRGVKKVDVTSHDLDFVKAWGEGHILRVVGYDEAAKTTQVQLIKSWKSSKITVDEITDMDKIPTGFAKEFAKLWKKFNPK